MGVQLKYFKLEECAEANEFLRTHFLSGDKSLNIGQNGIVIQYEDERGLSAADKVSQLRRTLRDGDAAGLVFEKDLVQQETSEKAIMAEINALNKMVDDLESGKAKPQDGSSVPTDTYNIKARIKGYDKQLKVVGEQLLMTRAAIKDNEIKREALIALLEKYEGEIK